VTRDAWGGIESPMPVIRALLWPLWEQLALFNLNRAQVGMHKAARQDIAELATNLALHLVSLTAIVCRNHDIQQMPTTFSDSLGDHI
jgi:hypothetical protein